MEGNACWDARLQQWPANSVSKPAKKQKKTTEIISQFRTKSGQTEPVCPLLLTPPNPHPHPNPPPALKPETLIVKVVKKQFLCVLFCRLEQNKFLEQAKFVRPAPKMRGRETRTWSPWYPIPWPCLLRGDDPDPDELITIPTSESLDTKRHKAVLLILMARVQKGFSLSSQG